MLKRLLITAAAAAIAASAAVISVYAAGFSDENWAQYERGFYTSTSNFTENLQEYSDTAYGTNQLTSVRMVASTSSKIDKIKNPVAYKYGENSSDYGEHATDKATYAHMRVYLATFDDANHDMFNALTLRMDKDGTGASRDTFVFSSKKDGTGSELYAVNYTAQQAYTTRDWFGILRHQGYNGIGPDGSTAAEDCDSTTRVLSDSDYDKLDIIVEYNKQNGATTYIFANGKFMADYYDSGLTDKHFHGIVFRTPANKTPRNNSSYIAVRMDPDRIGHREYYNTDDHMVTLEEVMQDAGLGDEVDDSTVMFKTSDIQSYMPGDDQIPYIYMKDASERTRINENVTYSGNTATIDCSNTDTENYAVAANMLAGFYPQNGKTGVSYESYHPRAKYIMLSFDQTISNDGMWLEYATRYSGAVRGLQMWNNGGYLVVGIKGGRNETCNGNEGKPLAEMTGTNHIDWLLEPYEDSDTPENGCLRQYVFVNGKLAGEGSFGGQYAVRLADVILSTMKAAGTVTIDNWSMTIYNQEAEYEDIRSSIEGAVASGVAWEKGKMTYEITEKMEGGGDIAVSVCAKSVGGYEPTEETKVITAIYDEGGNLLDIKMNPFVSGLTLADETVTNVFEYTEDMKTVRTYVWEMTNITPQVKDYHMDIVKE